MERARALKNQERENGSYLPVSPKSVESITGMDRTEIVIDGSQPTIEKAPTIVEKKES